MSARILDGKAIAAEVRAGVARRVEQRLANGVRAPGLAVILVGKNPASEVYVRNKRRACERAGIRSRDFDLPGDTSQAELLDLVARLNEDPAVDGILVQLPLPAHVEDVRALGPQRQPVGH